MYLANSRLFLLLALFLAVDQVYSAGQGFIRPNFPFNLLGPYCSRPRLGQEQCCEDRNDDCSRQIYGTLCYCDAFCDVEGLDCCPDYHDVCGPPDEGSGEPELEELEGYCPEMDNGKVLKEGESATENCNLCTCLKADNSKLYLQCERDTCLIRPSFISHHNSNPSSGWTAANYTENGGGLDFFGKKLAWGLKHKLGVLKPDVTQTHNHGTLGKQIPRYYDLRHQGHGISAIRNQGECGASWAYAVAGILTDKLKRRSAGQMKEQVSVQHLIDCNTRGQLGCNGGHVDRAAMFMKTKGGVSEQCYPEKDSQEHHCPDNLKHVLRQETVDCGNGTRDKPISSSIPYRVAQGRRIDVKNIQVEMMARGSVIALLRVHSDFYMYKEGIYRHDSYKAIPEKDHPTGYHAVRIIGWGDDGEGTKYWICANSWGTRWGENGYFRIVRGENHSDIEKFVIAIGNIHYDKTLLSRKFLAEHRRTRLMRHRRRIRSAFNWQ